MAEWPPVLVEGGSEECPHEFGALGAASGSYCIHCGAKLVPNPDYDPQATKQRMTQGLRRLGVHLRDGDFL